MERTKLALLLLASVLLNCHALWAQDKPLVVPNTALALPDGCGVRARWISPPLDPDLVSKTPWYGLRFSVDSAGRPWIGYQDDSIINPVRQYRFKLPQRYTSIACTEDGALLAATDTDLCFIVPPDKLETTYDNLPTALYQPIANLPAPHCAVYSGTGGCLYFVAPQPDGGSEVYSLRLGKSGMQAFARVFTSKNDVSAVTGDGTTTFLAAGGAVVKVSGADGSASKVYASPQEYVRGLAYLPGTGLFCSTADGIWFVGAKGCTQLMAAPDPRISLQKGTLYVLLTESLGVLALDGIEDLKRFDRTVKEVPATDSPDIRIASIRFFEAGKDAPEYSSRNYSARFDHKATRFIYCQADAENLQQGKHSHRQTLTMELYREGRGERLGTERVSLNCQSDYTTVWGWVRFGSEDAGTFYPGVYTVRTYLNGARVDESKFTITGEPSLAEAAANDDDATVSRLIKAGADVNAAGEDGYTPLMLAAWTSDPKVMKPLLDAGADVKAKTKDGDTALTINGRRWSDDPAVAQMLLAAGADIDAQGKDGQTALHMAVYRDNEAVARLLLERGARTDIKDTSGAPPLLATSMGFTGESGARIVQVFLEHGADPDTKGADGSTAIFSAVGGRCVEAVKALVKHGANVNATGTIYGTERSVLGQVLDLYKTFSAYREDRIALKEIAAILQANGADLSTSEFARACLDGVDKVLDARHMARLLEMSESAARNLGPNDAYLRKAAIRGLLNAALRQISGAKNECGYYDALSLCEEASDRARRWGMASSCPEISFNMGLIYMQVGSTDNASKYLKEYLDLAPAGSCAAKARELVRQIK